MATLLSVVVEFAFDNFKSVDTHISVKCKHCSQIITEAKWTTSGFTRYVRENTRVTIIFVILVRVLPWSCLVLLRLVWVILVSVLALSWSWG